VRQEAERFRQATFIVVSRKSEKQIRWQMVLNNKFLLTAERKNVYRLTFSA